MDKKFLNGVLIVIGIFILGLIFMMMYTNDTLNDQKYDQCLEEMQRAIPDPNDDGRADFLKNCYEN